MEAFAIFALKFCLFPFSLRFRAISFILELCGLSTMVTPPLFCFVHPLLGRAWEICGGGTFRGEQAVTQTVYGYEELGGECRVIMVR